MMGADYAWLELVEFNPTVISNRETMRGYLLLIKN